MKRRLMSIRKLFAAPTLVFVMILTLNVACETEQKDEPTEMTEDFAYTEATIEEIQAAYDDGILTAEALVQAYLDRIEAIDKNGPNLNSVISLNPNALERARELDKEMQDGQKRGPMHGIPVLLKDNIDTHDMPTTAGSRALKGSYPSKDSYLVQKLRDAGAIILGKTNLSEWANFRGELSTSGWSGLGGQTKNPYDLSRNPCGSSSGSAVAVSANLSMIAIGTETNGSIVCPSHSNGIVGIKPTVGLISRAGIIPISYTQDTSGPMSRTLWDAAVCLGVMTGVDSSDTKTLNSRGNSYTDYTQFLKKDGLKGKRIGWYKAPSGANFKVDSAMAAAVEFIKSQGAEVVEIENVTESKTGQYSFQVMLFEYKDGLNKYFESLGPDAPVKNLKELIAFNKKDSIELRYFNQRYLEMAQEKDDLSSEEYKEALEGMLSGSRENGIDKYMQKHNLDAFMAPTGSPAWKTDLINGDSFQLGSSSPAAHAGYPVITVPMDYIDGLPVGISFFGTAWSEPVLLEIAYGFEYGTQKRQTPKFVSQGK
jgi:amidase